MNIETFYDKDTGTFSYIVFDKITKDAVIIDPVLNYNKEKNEISNHSIRDLKRFIDCYKYKVHYIIESHIHADHLTGAHFLKEIYPEAKIAIGHNISKVTKLFQDTYGEEILESDKYFDHFLSEKDPLNAGSLTFEIIETPGHTPACICLKIKDHLFTGDTLFMPDFGTGRCDFPGGSSESLYNSITQKLYTLPEDTNVFVGHDYGTDQRRVANETTIKDCLEKSIHINKETKLEDFVKFRNERDKNLSPPKLIEMSLKINFFAGKIPKKLQKEERKIVKPKK